MKIVLIIGLSILSLVLFILLLRKIKINYSIKKQLLHECAQLTKKEEKLSKQIEEKTATLAERTAAINERYETEQKLESKVQYLEEYFNTRKITIDSQLEEYYNSQLQLKKIALDEVTTVYEENIKEKTNEYEDKLKNLQAIYETRGNFLKKKEQEIEDRYSSIVDSFKIVEKELAEKLFYTIELSDSDISDINILLGDFVNKINNKDVLYKLVWTTYIQKPLQTTLKRLNIEDAPGIYKITNIKDNKCYIGKSTKVRQRIIDHFKSACGISTISDQFLHHEMMKQGLNNWMIECVVTCDKEQLSELEKYYIDFFDSKNYGYNINSGG